MGKNARRWALMSGALLIAAVGFFAIAPHAGADDNEKVAWLGVYTQSLDDDLRDGLDYSGDGVLVNRVIDDSPADKAGLKKGDVIVRYNNRQIDSPGELADFVRQASVGQRVSIQVMRDGQRRTLNVTLGEREDSDRDDNVWYWDDDGDRHRIRIPRVHVNRHIAPDDVHVEVHSMGGPMLGVQVHYMNDDLASYFGSAKGALVLEVSEESAAEKAGIKAGDVITRVGETDIEGSNDIRRELREHDEGDKVAITVIRKGKSMQMTAELEEGHHGYGYRFGPDERDFVVKQLKNLEGLEDLKELRILGERMRERGHEIRRESREAEQEFRELRREMRELQRRLEDLEEK